MLMRFGGAGCTRRLLALLFFSAFVPGAAVAQGVSHNTGLLHISGGVDAPSLYVYRGVVQEGDPALTLTPWATLSICTSDTGRVCVETGVWNSLNTGSSGTGGPLDALHYSEQFYARVPMKMTKRLTVTPGYLANSSPNGGYETVQEFNVLVLSPGRFAPYALMAFELMDSGQVDGGSKKGSYLEIGATPTFKVLSDRWELSVPVKAGFSLQDYYELLGSDLQYVDQRFGFAQFGGRLTVPLTRSATRIGRWSISGGADVITLGDTTRAFNQDDRVEVVGTIGISMRY